MGRIEKSRSPKNKFKLESLKKDFTLNPILGNRSINGRTRQYKTKHTSMFS